MLAIPQPLVDHRPATAVRRNDQEEAALRIAAIGLFQDIPQRIWTTYLSAWAGFFALMILFFATNAATAFVVAIATMFGLMAFGLPMAMAAQSHCDGYECVGPIDTLTGPVTAKEASVQIALVPVAAVIGMSAFIALAM